MYLPFGKLCDKLLDIKCITLSSPLILRMNSVKLINTYSIVIPGRKKKKKKRI